MDPTISLLQGVPLQGGASAWVEDVVVWEGDLGGHRYRRISRAGETVYQRRVAGETPGDWRWKDWPRDPVLRLIEDAYTGVAG